MANPHSYEHKVGAVFGHSNSRLWKRYLHKGNHRSDKKTIVQRILGW